MIELIYIMMQHFLQVVILNMLFDLIWTLKLITLGIQSKFDLWTKGLNSLSLVDYLKIKQLYPLFLLTLKNKESPIICGMYIKSIHWTVLN